MNSHENCIQTQINFGYVESFHIVKLKWTNSISQCILIESY